MASFFVVSNSVTAQALTAGQNGFVSTTGTLYVELANAVTMTGATDLTVMGTVAASGASAVSLSAATGKIIVGAAGSIISNSVNGISGATASSTSIINAGTIIGVYGVNLATNGFFQLGNSGHIQSSGDFAEDAVLINLSSSGEITNSGVIESVTGTGISLSGSQCSVNNTGTISGTAASISTAGALLLENAGILLGEVFAQQFTSVKNTGQILGDVDLRGDNDVVTNSGKIAGNVFTSIGGDIVNNFGLVTGKVDLGAGNDLFVGTGGYVRGGILGGDGNDTFTIDDSRQVITDTVGFDSVTSSVNYRLSLGLDRLQLVGADGLLGVGNSGDEILLGGDGGDTLRGGAGNDTLSGGTGDNLLRGGLGSDSLTGGDDDDTLQGGLGNDTMVGTLGSDVLDGDAGLDTVSYFLLSISGIQADLAAGTLRILAQAGLTTLSGIEGVEGTLQADTILGNDADNILIGQFGADSMAGGNGNDRLDGGQGDDVMRGDAGNDVLLGMIGSDSLTGGFGADRFVYQAVSDSDGTTFTDTIAGFQRGSDVIDLAAIDANSGIAGDQTFLFLGTGNFSGAGQEVRVTQDTLAGATVVEIRLAGSVVNDMEIILSTANIPLTVDNFAL